MQQNFINLNNNNNNNNPSVADEVKFQTLNEKIPLIKKPKERQISLYADNHYLGKKQQIQTPITTQKHEEKNTEQKQYNQQKINLNQTHNFTKQKEDSLQQKQFNSTQQISKGQEFQLNDQELNVNQLESVNNFKGEKMLQQSEQNYNFNGTQTDLSVSRDGRSSMIMKYLEACVNHPKKKAKYYAPATENTLKQYFCSKCTIDLMSQGVHLVEVFSDEKEQREIILRKFLESVDQKQPLWQDIYNCLETKKEEVMKHFQKQIVKVDSIFEEYCQALVVKNKEIKQQLMQSAQLIEEMYQEKENQCNEFFTDINSQKGDISSNIDNIVNTIEMEPFQRILQSYEEKLDEINQYFEVLSQQSYKVQKINDSQQNIEQICKKIFDMSEMNTNFIKKSKFQLQHGKINNQNKMNTLNNLTNITQLYTEAASPIPSIANQMILKSQQTEKQQEQTPHTNKNDQLQQNYQLQQQNTNYTDLNNINNSKFKQDYQQQSQIQKNQQQNIENQDYQCIQDDDPQKIIKNQQQQQQNRQNSVEVSFGDKFSFKRTIDRDQNFMKNLVAINPLDFKECDEREEDTRNNSMIQSTNKATANKNQNNIYNNENNDSASKLNFQKQKKSVDDGIVEFNSHRKLFQNDFEDEVQLQSSKKNNNQKVGENLNFNNFNEETQIQKQEDQEQKQMQDQSQLFELDENNKNDNSVSQSDHYLQSEQTLKRASSSNINGSSQLFNNVTKSSHKSSQNNNNKSGNTSRYSTSSNNYQSIGQKLHSFNEKIQQTSTSSLSQQQIQQQKQQLSLQGQANILSNNLNRNAQTPGQRTKDLALQQAQKNLLNLNKLGGSFAKNPLEADNEKIKANYVKNGSFNKNSDNQKNEEDKENLNTNNNINNICGENNKQQNGNNWSKFLENQMQKDTNIAKNNCNDNNQDDQINPLNIDQQRVSQSFQQQLQQQQQQQDQMQCQKTLFQQSLQSDINFCED